MQTKRGFLEENRLENEKNTPFLLQVRQQELLMEKGSYTNKTNFMDFTACQCFDDGGDWYTVRFNQMGIMDITIKTCLASYVFAPKTIFRSWLYTEGMSVNYTNVNELGEVDINQLYKKRGFFKNHKDRVNSIVYADYPCSYALDVSSDLGRISKRPLFIYRPPLPEGETDTSTQDIGWWYYNKDSYYHTNESESCLLRDIRLPLDKLVCGSVLYSDVSICHIVDDRDGLISSAKAELTFDGTEKNGFESNWGVRNISRLICTIRDTSGNTYGMSKDGLLNHSEDWQNVYTTIHIIACINDTLRVESGEQEPINW